MRISNANIKSRLRSLLNTNTWLIISSHWCTLRWLYRRWYPWARALRTSIFLIVWVQHIPANWPTLRLRKRLLGVVCNNLFLLWRRRRTIALGWSCIISKWSKRIIYRLETDLLWCSAAGRSRCSSWPGLWGLGGLRGGFGLLCL